MAISLYDGSSSLVNKLLQSQLVLRTASALILSPLILYVIYKGGVFYDLLVLAITLLALHEWLGIVAQHQCESFTACENLKYRWHIIGVMFTVLLASSLVFIRNSDDHGYYHTLWLVLVVWATDIGAYFSGIIIGGPKLAPNISPKKTWSGSIGGILSALLVGIIFDHLIDIGNPGFTILSPVLSVISQIGDLLESKFKRVFKVKDSGYIIPGHGGILDRIDGLAIAAISFSLFLLLKLIP